MGINLKDVGSNTGDFDALPEGRYSLSIDSAEEAVASTGTNMIKIAFRVSEGAHKNRMLWHNFTLTPKSYVYLFQFLKAAGSELIDKDDVEPAAIVASLPGVSVTAFTEPGTTNAGNPKNDLSRWGSSTSKSQDLFS